MHHRFETAGLRPKPRFDPCHDGVGKTLVTAAGADRCGGAFDAHPKSQRLGAIEVGEMRAPPHVRSRGMGDIRAEDRDDFLLSIMTDGEGRLGQDGRTALQAAGDIVLCDTGRPYDYALAATTSVVRIPRRLLETRIANLSDLTAVTFSRDLPLAALLATLVRQAIDLDLSEDAQAVAGPRVAQSIIDVLLALFDLHRDDCGRSTPLERIMRFARANLADENLTPERLAARGPVSVRTLNRLFGTTGTTPMRWLWRQRLEASHAALLQGRARSVTEAAFDAGFKDLGHFSRSFKLAFGRSPEQLLHHDPARR